MPLGARCITKCNYAAEVNLVSSHSPEVAAYPAISPSGIPVCHGLTVKRALNSGLLRCRYRNKRHMAIAMARAVAMVLIALLRETNLHINRQFNKRHNGRPIIITHANRCSRFGNSA